MQTRRGFLGSCAAALAALPFVGQKRETPIDAVALQGTTIEIEPMLCTWINVGEPLYWSTNGMFITLPAGYELKRLPRRSA